MGKRGAPAWTRWVASKGSLNHLLFHVLLAFGLYLQSAGKAEYLWKDENAYQKPTRLPAPTYIDLALSEIDAQITDDKIFPVEESTCATALLCHPNPPVAC